MASSELHAVTGAFGYSGKYIAQRLLARGHSVITLTNSVDRENPFAGQVKAFPFHFDEPDKLAEHLRGVKVLYNTYWIRFNHKLFTHADAVKNTETLFQAAKDAGVERIVHISIANPSEDSPLEYYRGKAYLERCLRESSISYAILRPAVIFGKEDILINNIAWMLRHLPVLGVFGGGRYRIRPIYVDDLAALAVEYGARRDNATIDAIGPESFTYRELVRTIGRLIGVWRPLVPVPPFAGLVAARVLGRLVGDVILTRDEISGLMADLLHVDAPPTGTTLLTEWIAANASTLGRRYTSELARRIDRHSAYKSN